MNTALLHDRVCYNMRQDQFAAIKPYISTDLVGMIAKKIKYPRMMQLQSCIIQSCMPSLSRKKLKSGSTEMLYSLFEQEEETGKVEFPDV